MNLSGLELDLYDRLGYDATPATAVTTRLRRFLNETQRELVTMRGLARLRRNVLTFSSVASSPFAVLPQAVVKIITIQDRVNNVVLEDISIQDVRYRDPGLTSTSAYPRAYSILNLAAAVAKEPSAAAELFVISDSASDDATKKAYIEGLTTGGYYRTASVALNGITAASFGASITTWTNITKFYLALAAGGVTTAAGVVTLRQTSGVGTELSRIPIGRSFARYSRIHFQETPSQANTYYADCELHIEDMATAGDEPYLPEDFHWLLSCGALKKEYQKREKTPQVMIEQQRWDKGVADLKAFLREKTGVAAGSQRGPRGFSMLGPWYRAGT